MDSPQLTTLYDLLVEGYSVDQLATAVETHGVYGWDRFGRFFDKRLPPNKKLPTEALDALAAFHDYAIRFYEERDSQNDAESADLTSPAASLDQLYTPLHRLGWPQKELPQFCDKVTFPPALKLGRLPTPESPALHILGALLLDLADLRKTGHPVSIPSEDTLLKHMRESFPGVKWLSRTMIQDYFADSKRAVLNAQKRGT